MDTAPLFDDVADGPAGGQAAWLAASDGVRIRVGWWPLAGARGTVILLPGRTHSHALKDCLQREHLAPWRRAQLPLLFEGDQLLAAADVVVSAPLQAWLHDHDAQLQWRPGGW